MVFWKGYYCFRCNFINTRRGSNLEAMDAAECQCVIMESAVAAGSIAEYHSPRVVDGDL
ncbi:MAG: hypothetical protein LBI69_03550 [Puniceicoccales bacterium]|nr:hypothetical protein [Puniceicoccales bacterium]